MSVRIMTGDCMASMATLADASVQTCVTSPPYFGLRDYGHAGQIGLESSPAEYVARLVDVFRAVRRVLAPDGTVWLNLGDSYAAGGNGGGPDGSKQSTNIGALLGPKKAPPGFKAKDLLGIPWRVAFALQADGWWLRSDIVWHKPNPMPESVTDRPTKAHEFVFLLTKAERYYYDADAVREPLAPASVERLSPPTLAEQPGSERANGGTREERPMKAVPPRRSGNTERTYGASRGRPDSHLAGNVPWQDDGTGRNARSVWTVATQPYRGAHFATMPPELAARCILAGSRPGDTVLDPFGGAGTTGLVAEGHGRSAILCELNPEYARLAAERIGFGASVEAA